MARKLSAGQSIILVLAIVLGLSSRMPWSFVTPSAPSTQFTDTSHGFGSKAAPTMSERSQWNQHETRTSRSEKVMPRKAGLVVKAGAAAGLTILGTLLMNAPGIPTTSVDWRRFLHIPIKVWTRWEERWLGPVNFDRASLRITAMDTYALCAGVMLQTIMCLFTTINTNKPATDAPRLDHFMYDVQVFFCSLAALTSTWTLVVFLFNKIYCIKAISLYYDVNYAVFLNATRKYRVRAFQSLVISLITYVIAYGAAVFTTLSGKKGIYMCVAICIFGTLMATEGGNLVRDAQELAGGGVSGVFAGETSVAEP